MILVIDNYDSFVYNLVRYVVELGHEVQVRRNDAVTIDEIKDLRPTHILLSPGPCSPDEAGICVPLIQALGQSIPILGVCLGHQAIGQAFDANVIRAKHPIHGSTCQLIHQGDVIFKGLPSPVTVGCYYSLIVDHETVKHPLIITGWSDHGEVMALRHVAWPVYGVQFHPESILTPHGKQMVEQFILCTA